MYMYVCIYILKRHRIFFVFLLIMFFHCWLFQKKKLEDKVGGLKRKKMSCSSVEGEKPKKIKRLEKVKG